MEAENDNCLTPLLEKLNKEANNTIKTVEDVREKGINAIRRAMSIEDPTLKQQVVEQTHSEVMRLLEKWVDLNLDLELCDIDLSCSLSIPYYPVDGSELKLQLHSGENPTNFWLHNDSIDTKKLQKLLLKKHQNDILEPYPYPKPAESVCFLEKNKVCRGIVLQIIDGNRAKILDCDSNTTRVVTIDKVFKIDPDACNVCASMIKCTITKDSIDPKHWNSHLQNIFLNSLREASLRVKILERLPNHLPTFLVDVTMCNEETNEVANLKEWICSRLLRELKKLSVDEGESLCDFLSAEALDPYSEAVFDQKSEETIEKTSIPQETNNLNCTVDKKCLSSEKVVTNLEIKPVISKTEERSKATSSDKVVVTPTDTESLDDITNIKVSNMDMKSNTDLKNPVEPVISKEDKKVEPTSSDEVAVNITKSQSDPTNKKVLNTDTKFNTDAISTTDIKSKTDMKLSVDKSNADEQTNTGSTSNTEVKFSNIDIKTSNLNYSSAEFKPAQQEFISFPPNWVRPQMPYRPVGYGPSMYSYHQPVPSDEQIVHYEIRKPQSLFKPNDTFPVLLSHMETPDNFYVHFLSTNTKLLDKLRDDMFTHYNTMEKVHFRNWNAAKKALGKFCACKWNQDHYWYRVEILNWIPEDDKVKVYFVDHGNIDYVTLSSLQPLTAIFCKISMCAQPCHLAKVYPPRGAKEWPLEVLEFFGKLLKKDEINNEPYLITVVPTMNKKTVVNSLSVLLYEHTNGQTSSRSINDIINDFQKGLSYSLSTLSLEGSEGGAFSPVDQMSSSSGGSLQKLLSPPPPPLPVISGKVKKIELNEENENENSLERWDPMAEEFNQQTEDENSFVRWDPMAEEFESPRNNPFLDTDDPGVALTGYKARDEERICKFFARDGYCWKKVCNKEHILPHADGVTTDKEEVYTTSFSEIALPSSGEEIEVLVTYVDSISLIYVHLAQRRAVGVDDDGEEVETLQTLHAYMNEPDTIAGMRMLLTDPALGQLVLARFEDQWFRARVITTSSTDDCMDEDMFEVHFVDYGSKATVSIRDLRQMEPKYLHLPFQAVECSLANVVVPRNITQEKYDALTDLLRNTVAQCVLQAKVYTSYIDAASLVMEVLLHHSEFGDIGEFFISQDVVERRSLNWNYVLPRASRSEYSTAG